MEQRLEAEVIHKLIDRVSGLEVAIKTHIETNREVIKELKSAIDRHDDRLKENEGNLRFARGWLKGLSFGLIGIGLGNFKEIFSMINSLVK